MRARAAGWRALGAALLAAAAAACVRIDAGPNGIAAARLDASPPSIVEGDALRDSLGAPTTLRAVAFDASGRPVPMAQLRFFYVPSLRDSSQRPLRDTALFVDSLTGTVRATLPVVLTQGIVAVRVGGGLQLLDTLQIVHRPDSAAADADTTRTLRYDCTDDRPTFEPDTTAAPTALPLNASAAFGVRVLSDSGTPRTLVPVRQRLVRWTIESPVGIPSVPLPSGGPADTVPALAVVKSTAGSRLRFDTTGTDGRSSVRLRIRPTGLGRTVLPDSLTYVRLRGVVQPGASPVRGGTVFTVVVPILRFAATAASAAAACR